MEGNNTAPFEKGQNVVCVNDKWVDMDNYSEPGTIKKNDECKVEEAVWDGRWWIALDIDQRLDLKGERYYYTSDGFAPVKRTPAELEIEKEVWDSLPKITEERSDVVVKPTTAGITNELLNTIDEMIALLPSIPIAERFRYAQKIDEMINKTCKLIKGES